MSDQLLTIVLDLTMYMRIKWLYLRAEQRQEV